MPCCFRACPVCPVLVFRSRKAYPVCSVPSATVVVLPAGLRVAGLPEDTSGGFTWACFTVFPCSGLHPQGIAGFYCSCSSQLDISVGLSGRYDEKSLPVCTD